MAKLNNGFLGDASGKIGNVVFSKWRNIRTARAYNGNPTDPNTQAQQIQRLRMTALQAFLSPLNNNFIKFFNSRFAVNSTPWSKAIKDNMPAVDELGNIDLSKITFGNNRLPAAKIISSDYDPFIDCLKIKYDYPDSMTSNSNFPLIACSMLGMSKRNDDPFSFNVDNMIKFMPSNQFYCEFEDQGGTHIFSNFFDRGQFWLIPLQDSRWDMQHQSIPDNSTPTPFIPASEIAEFNMNFDYNPVPTEAVDLSFVGDGTKCDLIMKFITSKIENGFSDKNKVSVWFRLITKTGIVDLPKKTAQICDFPLYTTITSPETVVGAIALYCTLDTDEVQLGCFNRMYHGTSPSGVKIPYFDALFDFYGANPLSFKLPAGEAAIFGNVDELLGDFIKAYESGSVTGKPETFYYKNLEILIMNSGGQFVGKAKIRDNHDFYIGGLQNTAPYYIMASITPELIDLWRRNMPQLIDAMAKPIKKGSNVSYLCPSAIIAIHNQDPIPDAVLKALRPFLENSLDWSIPMASYTREALFNFQTSNPLKYKKTMQQDYPIALDGTVDN